MGMTSNYRQPVILQHRKPSMAKNYYIKNDFPSKKEGYAETNLSASHAERGQSNRSGAELAWGLPQSRGHSITGGNTNGLNSSQQSTGGNTNFRIHAGSGNVSRETSATKRMRESNLQLLPREDSQKQAGKLQLSASNATLGERRRSRVLMSRGGNQTGVASSVEQPLRQQTPSTQQVLPRPTLADVSPRASPTPPTTQGYLVLSQMAGGLAKPAASPTNHSATSTTPLARKSAPVELPTGDFPTVIWADQLNGEDIRTELKFGDCLGQGSFAKVYEGFDKRLKIPVAIKVIDKRKIKDNETKKRQLIEEELFIFCRLNHKNIVKFIRLVEDTKRVVDIIT
jgi:Protein kinase domain